MNISETKLHQGLYIPTLHNITHVCFQFRSTFPNQHVINKCTMWHDKLGHPSNETSIHINKVFPVHKLSKNINSRDTY